MEGKLAVPSEPLVCEQVPSSCPDPGATPPPPAGASLGDEPQTRADLLKYYRRLSLDPNTAYREMILSEDNRAAELTDLVQSYPEHPDRFTHVYQVLCEQGVTGRAYWEVEFTGSVEIAVAYKDLPRSDYYHQCAFGCNDKSWSLDLNRNYKCYRHGDNETAVPEPRSSRVGVFLDFEAGVLTFYCVSDTTLQLMYRAEAAFTRPLYPGLWVGATARLCEPQ